MEDLRNTAYAYRKAVRDKRGNEDEFANFFNELDKNRDDRIYFDEFRNNMNAKGYAKYGSDRNFFQKLTRGGRDYLEYCDIVTLLYIINSGRPFCDQCRYFIQGSFFTCVSCFETNGDFNYNLCPSCYYVKGKYHGHCHKEFVDSLSLVRLIAKRELSRLACRSGTSLRRPSLLTERPPASGSATSIRSRSLTHNSTRMQESRPSLLGSFDVKPPPAIGSAQSLIRPSLISSSTSVKYPQSGQVIGLISSTSIRKHESRPSNSSSIVRHQPIKRPSRALELMQFAVGCTTIAAAVSQLCTIM